jgi:hypothetical protein
MRKLIFLLLLPLAACVQPPISDSVANNIGAAYAQIKILAVSALEARRAGILSEEQAQSIAKRLQSAQDAVMTAELMLPKSEDKAAVALSAAITIIDQLRKELDSVRRDSDPGPSPGNINFPQSEQYWLA